MIVSKRHAAANGRARSRPPTSTFASSRRRLHRALAAQPSFAAFLLITVSATVGIIVARTFFPACTKQQQQLLQQASKTRSPLSTLLSAEIIAEDYLFKQHSSRQQPSFAFIFSTGRCGTQHFSKSLRSLHAPRAYITHEQEHDTLRTRDVVQRDYRRLVSSSFSSSSPSSTSAHYPRNKTDFNQSMKAFVKNTKLPFYNHLLTSHGAHHLVYTGHVPSAFGMLPSIIEELPPGAVRVLRIRRDRLATALSLMALGPECEDPWGATSTSETSAPSVRRRWFPVPSDAHTRLHVAPATWRTFNRFQRWLWYVDDVECRWQAMLASARGRFSHAEYSLDALHVLDGGAAWKSLAHFMGTDVDLTQALRRHNSIQQKNRTKQDVPEAVLRQWDEQYRDTVGACHLTTSLQLTWRP